MGIKENLINVNNNIQKACERSNRGAETVILVNVSKTKPIAILEEGYTVGMRLFGENKVQELQEKYVGFQKKDVIWHMIGHLQSNKVKYIVDKVDLIHSVDSMKLARTIEKEAKKKNCIVNILLQVNIVGETTKYGFSKDELIEAIPILAKLSNIKILGLMLLAPYVTNPEENRLIFRELHQLMVDINHKNIDNIDMNVLSMGMSNDYQVAIEEGATMIRIGTGLFGKRDYPKE